MNKDLSDFIKLLKDTNNRFSNIAIYKQILKEKTFDEIILKSIGKLYEANLSQNYHIPSENEFDIDIENETEDEFFYDFKNHIDNSFEIYIVEAFIYLSLLFKDNNNFSKYNLENYINTENSTSFDIFTIISHFPNYEKDKFDNYLSGIEEILWNIYLLSKKSDFNLSKILNYKYKFEQIKN